MSREKTVCESGNDCHPDIGFRPIVTCAIDDIALASLRRDKPEPLECSLCEAPIEGAPTSSGLLLWTRGDDIRYDEPPLCASCSTTLAVTAYARWYLEEEGDE